MKKTTQDWGKPGESCDGEIGKKKTDSCTLLGSDTKGGNGGESKGGIEKKRSSLLAAPAVKKKGQNRPQDGRTKACYPSVDEEESCENGAGAGSKGAKKPCENPRKEDCVKTANGQKVADTQTAMEALEFFRVFLRGPKKDAFTEPGSRWGEIVFEIFFQGNQKVSTEPGHSPLTILGAD
jgi:hypothetical protein